MTKRVLTLLSGVGLIALGGLIFAAPSRAYALELLSRFWPLFLALAGAARIASFLLDGEPRSPVGGMMLVAVGSSWLAFNLSPNFSDAAFTGELLLAFMGRYWFWLLLAFIAGRVLQEYKSQADITARPASAEGIFVRRGLPDVDHHSGWTCR